MMLRTLEEHMAFLRISLNVMWAWADEMSMTTPPPGLSGKKQALGAILAVEGPSYFLGEVLEKYLPSPPPADTLSPPNEDIDNPFFDYNALQAVQSAVTTAASAISALDTPDERLVASTALRKLLKTSSSAMYDKAFRMAALGADT